MDNSVSLGALLHSYANKQEAAFVPFKDFHDFVKRYASRHLEEQPNLLQYVEIAEEVLIAELESMSVKREVCLLDRGTPKLLIVDLIYYSKVFANRYDEMLTNPVAPFPIFTDLPKQIPQESFLRKEARDFIPTLFDQQDTSSKTTYCLVLPKDVPPILFPMAVPIQNLVRIAMAKIRHTLKKEESHDYFLKKMRNANPSKELGARSFFNRFIQQADNVDMKIEEETEAFYFWNQLCYFLRQDFENIKDKSVEDVNILQAISIADIWILAQKERLSKEQKKEAAIAEFEQCLAKPPYFFEMESMLRFKDSKGAPIYGQLGEDDLKALLQKLTTETKNSDLPELLVFKVESGKRYFIYKSNVFPLCARLANDAHNTIEKHLLDKWYAVLSNYEKLDEMKDAKAFEIELKQCVQKFSPALYALLNANFLPIINLEMNSSNENKGFSIFTGSKINSYSEILMLKNTALLSKVKMMLPFWYILPPFSWIAAMLFKKKTPATKSNQKTSSNLAREDISATRSDRSGKIGSKREVMAAAAKNISQSLVPEGSTIDRELDSYHNLWNKMLTPDARRQLTDDVNSLIRDYMRKVVKTISASTFNMERVQSLADALVRTPNMKKIGERDALFMYVQLYILRLVSNG